MVSRLRDVWILAENLSNIGDLMLLAQTVHALRNTEKFKTITVRQWQRPDDYIVEALHKMGVSLVLGKRISGLWPGRRLLLYGGGEVVRANASTSSLLALWGIMSISRLCGGKRVALGIGVSDLPSAFARFLWRNILSKFQLISCRDEPSQLRLVSLGVLPGIEITDDLAFLPSPLKDAFSQKGSIEHLLIVICSDTSEGRILQVSQLAALSCEIARYTGISRIFILCHDSRENMDVAVAHNLYQELTLKGFGDIKIISGFNFDELCLVYCNCGAVITNRLHAIIFSIISEKPVFSVIDGSAKIKSFVDRFGVLT